MEALGFERTAVAPACDDVVTSRGAGGASNGCGAGSVTYASIVIARPLVEWGCGDAGMHAPVRLVF
jgi:hypothetical protein